MGWTLAAKIWSSNTRSASVRVWTFTSLQPLLAGSHLFPQIKAQKKMKLTIRARALTSSLLDLCLSVSGGTSSASVFPFPFGCFLCTESQNASLCRVASHAIWQGAQHKRQRCYVSEGKGLFAGSVLWREKEGAGKPFCTIDKRGAEIISQGRDSLSFQDPTAACLESGHERGR